MGWPSHQQLGNQGGIGVASKAGRNPPRGLIEQAVADWNEWIGSINEIS
jgi:hypothetical protein